MNSAEVAQLYRQSGQTIPKEFRDAEELKKHKYNAKRKVCEGISFASALEARAWRILTVWERSGAIQNLRLQPVYLLQDAVKIETTNARGKVIWKTKIRPIRYIGDFQFWKDGRETVVDTKGIETQLFVVKKKMFCARFPDVNLVIWNKDRVKELEGR